MWERFKLQPRWFKFACACAVLLVIGTLLSLGVDAPHPALPSD